MTGESGQAPAPTGPEAAAAAQATIRVVSGRPTDEELAALVAVLAAASGGGGEPPEPSRSRWSAPATRLRSAYGPGRGAWRASGLPG